MFIITKKHTYSLDNTVYFADNLLGAQEIAASLQTQECNTDEWVIAVVVA